MKNCCVFIGCCCFALQLQAQTVKKDIFAFPITAYTVSANDSIRIVQVALPLASSALIDKGALFIMRYNYSNNKEDTAAMGWGRCQLIKNNYYYFGMHSYTTTGKPQKDDLLYTLCNYPASFKGRIYGLVQNAVYFEHLSGGNFYDFNTASLVDQQKENSLVDSLSADIKFTGKEMQQQNSGQDQDIKGGIFDGKKLFAAMQTVTAAQVKDFLDYVIARPRRYAGNTWKISETFASWMVSATPTVIKKG